MDQVIGGSLVSGSTAYSMVEARYNGTVVWPRPSYAISNIRLIYYNNTYISAGGGGYAYILGDILEYIGSVYSRTIYDVQLTPYVYDPSGHFYRDGNIIHAYSLGTTETSSYTTYTVTQVYYSDVASASTSQTVYQSINSKTITQRTVPESLAVSINTSSFPAAGGTATLTATEYYHIHYTESYSSGAAGAEYDGQTTTRDASYGSSYYLSPSVAWVSISGRTVTVAASQEPSARSTAIYGYYDGLYSNTVSISQAMGKEIITIYLDIGMNYSSHIGTVTARANSPVHSQLAIRGVVTWYLEDETYDQYQYNFTINSGQTQATSSETEYDVLGYTSGTGVVSIYPTEDTYATYEASYY